MADFWDQFPTIDTAISASGQPWGTQPGSRNTGIAGGMMSQGGPVSDPRWTNGTWGDPGSFDPSSGTPAGGVRIDPTTGHVGSSATLPTLGTIGQGGFLAPNLPWAISQAPPPVDPSRYDPSKSFDDYYRDYHAPDRDAVLRSYPGMRMDKMLQGGGSTTLGSLGLGGGLGGALGGGGLGGALGGALGGFFGGGGARQPGTPSLAGGLASILTPGGRRMQIPSAQLQEALKRGARQVGG